MVPQRSRWFERGLIAVGVWLLAWVWIESLEAEAFRRRLEASAPVAVTASDRTSSPRSALVGRLEIPRLGVSHVVAEGDSEAVLAAAIGHLSDTPMPWERGNSVLAGHRDGVFRPLKDVRVGDVLRLVTVSERLRVSRHGDDDRPANGHVGAGTIGSENADADHVLSVHVRWAGAVSVCGESGAAIGSFATCAVTPPAIARSSSRSHQLSAVQTIVAPMPIHSRASVTTLSRLRIPRPSRWFADVAAQPGTVDELEIEAFRTARVARRGEQQEHRRRQQRQEDPQHAQGHQEGAADNEQRPKESPPHV